MSGFRPISFDEIILLATCMWVFSLLHFAARGVMGLKVGAPVMPLLGLMFCYVAYVFGSLFVNKFSLEIIFIFLCILAFVGVLRSRPKLFSEIFYLSLSILCSLPLLILALVVNEPQWDDFTNWLVSAKYLYENKHLPSLDNPIINHVLPSYPYSRAMLHAWVNLITGQFTINVQPIFNTLFLSSLFLWPTTFFNLLQTKKTGLADQSAFILTGSAITVPWIAILGSTMAVSSYADPIFSICFVHIFMVFFLKCSVDISSENRINFFHFQIMFLLLAAVSIKESGMYLGILIIGVVWIYDSFFSKMSNVRQWFINQSLNGVIKSSYLLPAVLFTFIWSFYLNKNDIPTGFEVQDADSWNLDVLPQIIKNSMLSFGERPYSLFAFITLFFCSIILYHFRKKIEKRYRPLIFFPIGFFIFCYLFQIAAYCFAFTSYEALYAVSFTRYMAPAGLVAVFGIGMLFILVTKDTFNSQIRLAIAGTFFVGTTLTIILIQDKINPKPRINQSLYNVATSIVNSYPKGKKLLLIDIESNGFEATVVRYHIGEHMPVTYRTLYPDPKQQITHEMIDGWKKSTDFLYFLSGPEYALKMFGIPEFYVDIATQIKENCRQNSSLLLVDRKYKGEEAKKLAMVLNGYFKISVQSSKSKQSARTLNVDCKYNMN